MVKEPIFFKLFYFHLVSEIDEYDNFKIFFAFVEMDFSEMYSNPNRVTIKIVKDVVDSCKIIEWYGSYNSSVI
jgi:hypothetical protein